MIDEATSKAGKVWLYVVGLLALLSLLYALSIGPAYVLAVRKALPEEVLNAYKPVGRLALATGTEDAFMTYISAWFSLTGTPNPF